ncbi:hypothetical protein EVC62_02125 [Salinicola endophyticus]|uniref:Tape measure protein N-terminal domain-containing protein n=1 Tax=Salinicola endophyticus TaxID=1949083 RepID=A0ABY8FIL7_9GAMM|nr:tape measure protein [Salinicola endophyticus]WFF40391.1 hypothetical protein EVC62_02125 [Salinicola endophyticus]
MASSLRELIVRISADSSQYQREMARASRMGSDYYKSIEGGARRADAAMHRNQRQVEAVRASMGAARQQAVAFFAAYAGIESVRGVVRQADAWKNTNARIQLATRSQREFEQAQTGLLQLSNQTRTSFEANANLFARSAQSVRDYGGSVQDALDLTESISLGLRLSGATAEETSSVITQLSQALASGVLRGEEFNAINQSGGRAAQALADGLGVARGELKAMADAGQLTTGRVLQALTGQLGRLRAEAETLPDTVGSSIQVLNNQWLAYVGRQDAATGSTQVLSTAILGLADNLDTVANAGTALAAGVLAGYFTKLGRTAGSATIEVIKGTRAQISHAAAQREAATQLVRRTEAEKATAKASLATAQAQYNAARGTNAEAFATQSLSSARDRYAIATSQAGAATNALAAANSRLNTVMAVSRRLGAGLLGLLGGPAGLVGIVASVAAGWLLYRDNTQEAAGANVDMSATLDDLRKKFRALNDDQQRAELVAWGQRQREESEKAQAAYDELRESIAKTFSGQFGQRVARELDKARESGEAYSAVVQRLQSQYGLSDRQVEPWLILAGRIADAEEAARKASERQESLSGALVQVSDAAIQASRAINGLNAAAEDGPSAKALDKWRSFNDRLREQAAALRDPSQIGAAGRELDSLGIHNPALRGYTLFQASQLEAERDLQTARKEAAAEAKRVAEEAVRNAQRVSQAYQQQQEGLQREIALYGDTTRAAAMLYDTQHGSLQSLSDAQKQRLVDLAGELDLIEQKREAEKGYRDLVAALYTDQERLFQQTQQRFEQLQEWRESGAISDDQYKSTSVRAFNAGFEKAPKYGGLSADVGGAIGDLNRANEAQKELEKWRQEQLDQLSAYREAKIGTQEEWNEKEREIERQHQEELRKIEGAQQASRLAASSEFFGNLADLSSAFAGQQSGIYKTLFAASKAFAIAESIVKIQQGIANAAALPFPANIPAMATVASATAGIVSTISGTQMAGYDKGGYTGPGGKYTVAGIVHAGEYVLRQEVVNQPGMREYLDQLNTRGYASGGMVAPTSVPKVSPAAERPGSAMMGSPTIHVDARGATDPAAVRRAAEQGAEMGYRRVFEDVRTNGPIRRKLGV